MRKDGKSIDQSQNSDTLNDIGLLQDGKALKPFSQPETHMEIPELLHISSASMPGVNQYSFSQYSAALPEKTTEHTSRKTSPTPTIADSQLLPQTVERNFTDVFGFGSDFNQNSLSQLISLGNGFHTTPGLGYPEKYAYRLEPEDAPQQSFAQIDKKLLRQYTTQTTLSASVDWQNDKFIFTSKAVPAIAKHPDEYFNHWVSSTIAMFALEDRSP